MLNARFDFCGARLTLCDCVRTLESVLQKEALLVRVIAGKPRIQQ